jgi:tellurite methyltransferase
MTGNIADTDSEWSQYYELVSGRPPRDFLFTTLNCFQETGTAIDLGCGAGTESILMLGRGWRVIAIDQAETGIKTLHSNIAPTMAERLETRLASFEAVDLPLADLIWAGVSLPFCQPAHFDSLWSKIRSALVPGGRFAGDLFGPRHAWSNTARMTFHTREQVETLLEGFALEYLEEGHGEMLTALDGIQHWHMFTFRARKL